MLYRHIQCPSQSVAFAAVAPPTLRAAVSPLSTYHLNTRLLAGFISPFVSLV